MRYIFIGENRSKRAIKMKVRLHDGRLAAKQLFDGLKALNIAPIEQLYVNLFEPLEKQGIICTKNHTTWLLSCAGHEYKLVAMGNKVSRELSRRQIEHIKIAHPAARSIIRKKRELH